jgi:hypothetical protein
LLLLGEPGNVAAIFSAAAKYSSLEGMLDEMQSPRQ